VSVGLGLTEELCTKGTFQRHQSLCPHLCKACTEGNKLFGQLKLQRSVTLLQTL